MDETDLLDRTRRVAEAFRPAAPIDRRNLFSGRGQQIADVFSVVAQPGQHAVVYGERGVGKTSLGLVIEELLQGANVLSPWATCDASDDFTSVWRKALGETGFTAARHAIGFGERVDETIEAAPQLLGPDPVTPHAVRGALRQISRQSAVAIFVDELDRFQDRYGRTRGTSSGCRAKHGVPSSRTRWHGSGALPVRESATPALRRDARALGGVVRAGDLQPRG